MLGGLLVCYLGAVDIRVLAEAVLHVPGVLPLALAYPYRAMLRPGQHHVLELVNAFYALWLLVRVHEAAECGLEFLAAGAVGHAAQAGAVEVDLARLRVEGALLAGLLLELLWCLLGLLGRGGDGVGGFVGGWWCLLWCCALRRLGLLGGLRVPGLQLRV